LALACFFFIFAVKAFTALAISASAFAASAAFAALAFAAISTARALALAILIFALTAAALAAALRAALAAAPADLLLTADLALAAAFFADAAFFRAAFTFLVAAFAFFCNFASAAFALDKAGVLTFLAANFFFAGAFFLRLTLAILVSLLGNESCPLTFNNYPHYSPETYHINYLAYSKLGAKTDQIKLTFKTVIQNSHFYMVLKGFRYLKRKL
jgi:hypothetical protein